MDKLLDHARTVHLALIALCAAVVTFAAAGTSFREAKDAIRALERIKQLKVDTLAALINEKVSNSLDKSGFTDGLNKTSAAIALPIGLRNFNFGETEEADNLRNKLDKGSLADIQEYFSGSHPITMAMPDEQALFAILTERLPPYRDVIKGNPETFRLQFAIPSNYPERGWQFSLNWPHPDPRQRSFGIGRFENLPTPPTSTVTVETLSVRSWLTSQLLDTEPLAPVRPFWPELKDQRLDLALASLRLLESREDEKIELLGFKVQGWLAALAAATASLIVMLYLLAQVTEIRRVLNLGTPIPAGFPWFALYEDRLSTTLALASVTALPVCSVTLLLVRRFRQGGFETWLPLAELFAILGVSILLTKTLHSLRRSAGALRPLHEIGPTSNPSEPPST